MVALTPIASIDLRGRDGADVSRRASLTHQPSIASLTPPLPLADNARVPYDP